MKAKEHFEYNDIKSEFTGQPNPNKDIASSMINRAIKSKLAIKELENKREQRIKEEARRLEKQAAPQQSTTEFLNMSFEPPKRDIVEMMTPQTEIKSTALTPYKENKSFLDFLIGGTPQKTKKQSQTEKKIID